MKRQDLESINDELFMALSPDELFTYVGGSAAVSHSVTGSVTSSNGNIDGGGDAGIDF